MKTVGLAEKISYDASKWQKFQVLLDAEEFEELLNRAGGLLFDRTREISIDEAVSSYSAYIEALKQGSTPPPPSFSWIWSLSDSALYILDTGAGTQIRPLAPVVQITHHQMNYVPEAKEFRSNLFGPETIYWGLQFAFPQLFMKPDTKEVVKVLDAAHFENVNLFKVIKQFIRESTIPTPFEEFNSPQRIGKKALEWIGAHPHLQKKGLKVKA